MTKPQALMELDEPAVISGMPICGLMQLIEDRKSSPQQRGVGRQLGAGPRIVCRLPAQMSQGKRTPFPPNIANSMAESIAHNADAKEFVTPSTPNPLVILSSVMTIFPVVGLRICPLLVRRWRRNGRQLISLSRSLIVGVDALKTIALTVKKKVGLFLSWLKVLSQEGSAACVMPGPQIGVDDPVAARRVFTSFTKLVGEQLPMIPLEAKLSASSNTSIGVVQNPDPMTLCIEVAQLVKMERKLSLAKLAFSMSKPKMTWPLALVPAALAKVVILELMEEQLLRQVVLKPRLEYSEQLYLQPIGHCVFMLSPNWLLIDPKALEFASRPMNKVEPMALLQIWEKFKLTPAKLGRKTVLPGWKLLQSVPERTVVQEEERKMRERRRPLRGQLMGIAVIGLINKAIIQQDHSSSAIITTITPIPTSPTPAFLWAAD